LFSGSTSGDEYEYNERYDYEHYDGNYFATIEFTNNKTGYKATYTAIITVESDEIVKIHFPNGGGIDKDHFTEEATILEEYVVIFTHKNTEFYITEIREEEGCINSGNEATQCRGTTKKGARCKNMTDNASGYCRYHN